MDSERLIFVGKSWTQSSGCRIFPDVSRRFGVAKESLLPVTERDTKKVRVAVIQSSANRQQGTVRSSHLNCCAEMPVSCPPPGSKLSLYSLYPIASHPSPRSDITYFLRLRRKAELEILSTLTFAQLPSPFPPHLNQNTRPELLDAWNATARGPLSIPYLITKLSTYLPPLN